MLIHIHPRKRKTNNTYVDILFPSSSIVFEDILAMLNNGLFY